MLQHLTEAKRWFDEVPDSTEEVWRYFLKTELLHAVLDADPLFKPYWPPLQNLMLHKRWTATEEQPWPRPAQSPSDY